MPPVSDACLPLESGDAGALQQGASCYKDVATVGNDEQKSVIQLENNRKDATAKSFLPELTLAFPGTGSAKDNVKAEAAPAAPAADHQDSELKRLFDKNKERLDTDKDGFVSKTEIDKAMASKDFTGEDARLVAVLKEKSDLIQGLSNDEIGSENDGITSADVNEYDKLAHKADADLSKSEKDALNQVRGQFDWARQTLNNTNHDIYGGSADPLEAIKPEAVLQGQIGDCYFVSALSSLAARNPQAIKDMITENKDGTYTVTFPGDPDHPVTVDAPTDSELARYAQGNKYGTWPAIIEKAYGKYNDGNAVVNQDGVPDGSCRDAGVAILSPGKDSDYVSFSNADEIDKKMQQAIADGQPITAHTDNELGSIVGISDNKTDDAGLQGGHDYAVVGYDPVTKTVTLRNPWGRGEPMGEDGKAKDGVDNGEFKMTLEEFQKNFDRVAYGQKAA